MSGVVVVESPAKAKTIEKYLGGGFKVLASYGHVRDLIPKEGAVDPKHGFRMRYDSIERNEKHVKAIKAALKKADTLYLATDPDREGEAISWHLYELLKEQGALEGKDVQRVVFYEITKRSIQEAMDNPRGLSTDLIDAQQARRALDYLFGFNLSPLLWKKIMPKLSAGRVQSPALRMIVEREEEIEAFNPQEYWTLEGDIKTGDVLFNSRLVEYQGDKVEQFTFTNEAQATAARDAVIAAAGGKVRISNIDKKQRRRNPAAPFTTSTLQQEAARKLGFNTQRTMRTAQSLYEGIETSEGTVGLITYMRTDSVSLANEAVTEIRELITQRYGKENVPDEQRVYKTKAKNAQEAHEGIRPTSVMRTPEELQDRLEPDQFKLYSLIWKRTVACQMVPAVFDTVAIDLQPENNRTAARLRANGSTLVEPGFIAVYQEGSDDGKDDDGDRTLPPLEENELLELAEFKADQHFTDPPPRYTEASLVKTLEEYGIGRPSTYANIISTLKNREYVEMDGKRFLPTDVGRIVSNFLTNHFTQYVDYDFTANLEDELDEVSRGEREWVPVLQEFWEPFHELVDDKEATVSREEAAQARQLGTDPKSGKPVSVRMGRYGAFVQIGTKDDEDKPKFAGLKPGQKLATISFEEAMELFKLPRKLGETPEGEKVSASIGRFGPYVRYADKFVSIRGEDPYTITLEAALEFIKQKKIDDANKLILDFPDDGIQVLNGRYGPYITNKEKNARVPKDREPNTLTLEECKELLEKAPFRGKRGKKKVAKKAAEKKKTTKKKAAKKKKKKKKAASKKAKKKASGKKAASESDRGASTVDSAAHGDAPS
ncbi:MAG: DNA topoisomerase I [Gammaproteobacteria bacterium]|jgi:DNA topoisomerase-1